MNARRRFPGGHAAGRGVRTFAAVDYRRRVEGAELSNRDIHMSEPKGFQPLGNPGPGGVEARPLLRPALKFVPPQVSSEASTPRICGDMARQCAAWRARSDAGHFACFEQGIEATPICVWFGGAGPGRPPQMSAISQISKGVDAMPMRVVARQCATPDRPLRCRADRPRPTSAARPSVRATRVAMHAGSLAGPRAIRFRAAIARGAHS